MSADLTSASLFTEYTIESAPPAARKFMTATRNHLGYVPAGLARMAASPQLLDGFGKLTAIFDRSRQIHHIKQCGTILHITFF